MGGNYITWFNEEGSRERSLLYKLEDMGIVRCHSESEGKGWTKHQWKLTDKGQKLVEENKRLQDIWKDGKTILVLDFYKKVIEIINKKG